MWDTFLIKKKKKFTVAAESLLTGCCRLLFLSCPSDLVHETLHVVKHPPIPALLLTETLGNYIEKLYYEILVSMREYSEVRKRDSAVQAMLWLCNLNLVYSRTQFNGINSLFLE